MSGLRKFFDTDVFGDAIDPDKTYCVVYKIRPDDQSGGLLTTDYVSGEDLLACADFVDQLMSQKEMTDGNDDQQTD